MPKFTILPRDKSSLPHEFVAPDGRAALLSVQRYRCKDVDVLRDGEYYISARVDEMGVWSIYRNAELEGIADAGSSKHFA